jgi:hypothetical protein
MANLGESINVNDLPEDQGGDFAPIPAGDYHVKIVDSDLKDTKAGNGQYIKVRLDVMGPSHQGRVLFSNINIRNPNPKAEEIGRQQLGSILRAIGLASLTDTDQLIGGELSVKVTVKDDPTYGPGNEVKGYKAISGSVPPAPANNQPAAQAPTGSKPPWAK